VNQEDLTIEVDGNVLNVRGERKLEREEKGRDFRRIERQYGSFQRSLTLPPSVDPDNVEATYENGVLRIRFAKREEARARQIRIGEGRTITAGERPPRAYSTPPHHRVSPWHPEISNRFYVISATKGRQPCKSGSGKTGARLLSM